MQKVAFHITKGHLLRNKGKCITLQFGTISFTKLDNLLCIKVLSCNRIYVYHSTFIYHRKPCKLHQQLLYASVLKLHSRLHILS